MEDIKMTISVSIGDRPIWRLTEGIDKKCATRLGMDEYKAVIRTAEFELLAQIQKHNKPTEKKKIKK